MAWKTSIASSILKKKRNNNINLLPMSLSHVGKALLFAGKTPIKSVSTDTPPTYLTGRVRDIPLKRLQSPNEKLNNNEGITNMTGQTILISEVISRLQKLQAEHGDVRCVTPGFDESYLRLIQGKSECFGHSVEPEVNKIGVERFESLVE